MNDELNFKTPANKPLRGWLSTRHRPSMILAMALICAGLVTLAGWRAYSNLSEPSTEFDWTNRGFSDFHNGTYFPTRAFLNGKSPYSSEVANDYSMARETPPYSPVVFLLHAPFALLPIEISRLVFFLYNVLLLGAIAFCSIKMAGQPIRWFDFLAAFNLLLLSRPGHQTLFTGYFTAEIVLGCIVALHYAAKRPAVSGLGLVLASIKPTFILPLALLMLFRKNLKAVLLGTLFAMISAGLCLGWLAKYNGLASVVRDVQGGQEALHVDPTEMPVNTWTRVDLLGMYAKIVDWVPSDSLYLLTMVMLVVAVGIVIAKRLRRDSGSGATGLGSLLICLTVLLSIYHHVYDCLLLAVPAIGLACSQTDAMPKFLRMLVLFLLAVVGFNYLSTLSAMEFLSVEKHGVVWQGITLINGSCLLLATVILLWFLLQRSTTGKVANNS